MKYKALLKWVLQAGLFASVCGFILGYLGDYGLSTEGMTVGNLVTRGLQAFVKGMLIGGVMVGIPGWFLIQQMIKDLESDDPVD